MNGHLHGSLERKMTNCSNYWARWCFLDFIYSDIISAFSLSHASMVDVCPDVANVQQHACARAAGNMPVHAHRKASCGRCIVNEPATSSM